MSYTLDLSKIRKSCKFYADVYENGDEPRIILRGVCKIKDTAGDWHTYKNQIELTSIIKEILNRINPPSHTSMAGPLSLTIEHAGGWLSDTYGKASQIARNIGENRIAQDIYNDVLPEVAPFVPGGSAALQIADKAHDVVVKMRDGSPQAVAQAHRVAESAQSGSHAAQQVLSVMKRMGQMLKMKEEYNEHVGGPPRRRSREHGAGQDQGMGGRATGWRRGEGYDERAPTRRKRVAPVSRPRSSIRPGVRDWRTPQDPSGTGEYPEGQDDASADPYEEGYDAAVQEYYDSLHEEQVQGWLYNKPYRDPLTALSQLNHDPMFIARMLYNEGMDVSAEINHRRRGK